MDEGRQETDDILTELEEKIRKEYDQASKEVQDKLDDYLRRFKIKDEIKQRAVKQGTITQAEYEKWRLGQVMMGKRWEEMRDTLAEDLVNADKIAMSITRGYMPEVYALNHNYGTFEVENEVNIDTSYTLYDRSTVERLLRDDPNLLPSPRVNIPKDLAWNKRKITSAVTQGILQGESMDKIARRLQSVSDMDYRAAIRNARTATTGAENAGRIDSYSRARDLGIDVRKQWLSSLDSRTRDSHVSMDGEVADIDGTFKNGLKYPGDPHGAPEEVYNCRCTLIPLVKGIDNDVTNLFTRNNKLGTMTYVEWKGGKQSTGSLIRTDFTGIRKDLGNDYVDAMETLLNFTPETDVKDLFYAYQDKLKVSDAYLDDGGAYFSPTDGGVHMNANTVQQGTDLHVPYETAFHEFGHNIDYASTGGKGWYSQKYKDGLLDKTIKQEWKETQLKHIDEMGGWKYVFGDPEWGVSPTDDAKTLGAYLVHNVSTDDTYEFFRDLRHKLRHGEISVESVLNDYKDDILSSVIDDPYMAKIINEDIIQSIKSRGLPLPTVGNISDTIESCTGIGYPLGAGHGSGYWVVDLSSLGVGKIDANKAPLEFFAEVCDSKATNPDALALTREFFPNSVRIVEEIIQEMIK